MGVRILEDKDGMKCLYCSVSMVAFGNIFYDEEDPQDFLDWLETDPRKLKDKELENEIYEWRKQTEQENGDQ